MTRILGKEWVKLRKAIGLTTEHQFYSLKDSGITDLLLSVVPAREVQKQAGHSSLAMTEKYVHDIEKNKANYNIVNTKLKF